MHRFVSSPNDSFRYKVDIFFKGKEGKVNYATFYDCYQDGEAIIEGIREDNGFFIDSDENTINKGVRFFVPFHQIIGIGVNASDPE